MKNSQKILKVLADIIETGVLSSKDINNELTSSLKFKRDKIINTLRLVPREEFEVLKKIVDNQDKVIKNLKRKKSKR